MLIDGYPIAARGTVLDACRSAGADVPAFCYDPRLPAGAHCRSCLVEVDGRWVPACTTPAHEGLDVRTETEGLRAYRRDLGELMCAEAEPAGRVRATLEAWGVTGGRYVSTRTDHRDTSHPILALDLDRCIRCQLCVGVCAEIQGEHVYAMEARGAETVLGWGGVPFGSTPCVSCGACVQACPTEAITDRDRADASAETTVVRTTCGYCGVGCQLDVHVHDDRIGWIDGTADAAVNQGHLCVKGRYSHTHTRHPDRLTTPLVRRAGVLVPATWDEAVAEVVAGLSRSRGHVGFLSSSRCTNEENWLVQRWARAGFGTNDVDCCARVCHAPSARGMREVFGTGAATGAFADIEVATAMLVFGANPIEAHPIVGARIRRAALHGVPLVVVDPRRTALAEIADVHLQVRPGANVPLLQSLAHVIIADGLLAHRFLAERVDGLEAFVASVADAAPERTEALTGVPAARLRQAAALWGGADRPGMVHGLGVTEHLQGSEAVMLLSALSLLVGAVGRPGAGVNPLRGQNNVQGAADMGCQPDLLPGYLPVGDEAARARFAAAWGAPLPAVAGRTVPMMLAAARSGELRAMYVLGEDLAQTDPDTNQVLAALRSLDFLVVQELFLSRTAELAHVVLPGASALEKDGTFTNAERRIQRVRRAVSPPGDARPDLDILRTLMEATGMTGVPGTPAAVMDEIASLVPAFAGVRYERLDGDGLQWPVPAIDHPGTPLLHTATFPIGRARLVPVPFVPSPSLGGELSLVTGRVLPHYNAGTMTRRGPSAALCDADRLEIAPADAQARGIADGARVEVRSTHGVAHAVAQVTDRVQPGVVFLPFHFPETETNAVTTDVRDRLSDCPEYKLTAVTVRAV